VAGAAAGGAQRGDGGGGMVNAYRMFRACRWSIEHLLCQRRKLFWNFWNRGL